MPSDKLLDRIARTLSELDYALLYLLSANGEAPIPTKIALQKEMFLVANYIDSVHDATDFEPHSYGPYSEPVENGMDQLVKLGLVRQEGSQYKINDQGREISAHPAISFSLTNEEYSAVDDFKDFINDLTTDEILLYIYVTFPDYIEESLALKRVMGNRKTLARSIYRKGKVSLEKAAELTGSNIESFLNEVRS